MSHIMIKIRLFLFQENLERLNMQYSKLISTSLPVNFKLSFKMCPSNEAEKMEMCRLFRTTSLMKDDVM